MYLVLNSRSIKNVCIHSLIFIRPFEKRDVLWEHLRRAGGQRPQSFHQVFIKLGEYVGVHNVSTKFYNQPNPPCTPEFRSLNCPKLGFTLSKSKSFHLVFIKLGEYVGGHNISTKFYNLQNPPRPTLNYGP